MPNKQARFGTKRGFLGIFSCPLSFIFFTFSIIWYKTWSSYSARPDCSACHNQNLKEPWRPRPNSSNLSGSYVSIYAESLQVFAAERFTSCTCMASTERHEWHLWDKCYSGMVKVRLAHVQIGADTLVSPPQGLYGLIHNSAEVQESS